MNKPIDILVIPDKRRILEIIAVIFTGAGKFIFMDMLNWKLPFIATAIIFWVAYIWTRKIQIRTILKYWGFRVDNFKEVMMVLPFGIVSLLAFLVIGYFQNTLNITWHIISILIIYPIWGSIQQFLVIGLIAGNLQDLQANSFNKTLIIVFTAMLFVVLHAPHIWLVIGTFFLALFYRFIYLKARNVYVLGLFHGWLGGLFFYTVVNRDPFLEVFG